MAGSNLMFERSEKVIPVDDYSLMAVAGVPAIAFEISRILSQYFEYYRRTQIRPMSLEGKIRAFSKNAQGESDSFNKWTHSCQPYICYPRY